MSFKLDAFNERFFWNDTEIFTEDGEVFDLLASKFSDIYLSEIPRGIKVQLCDRIIGSSELTQRSPYAVFEKIDKNRIVAHLTNPFFLSNEEYPEEQTEQYFINEIEAGEKKLNSLKRKGLLINLESDIYEEIAYLSYSIIIENQSLEEAEYYVSKIIDNVSSGLSIPSIFICHASEDKPFVDKLVKELDKYAFYAWYDKREIFIGDSIVEKVNKGLENTKYLIAVLSKNSIKKTWVQKELNSTLMRQLSKEQVIILPILIENCDIPAILKDIKYADFTKDFNAAFKDLIKAIKNDYV